MGFSVPTGSTLRILLVALLACFLSRPSGAQAGLALDTEAWLRYARLEARAAETYRTLPATSVLLGKSPILENAQRELGTGVEKLLGRPLNLSARVNGPAIVLGTIKDVADISPSLDPPSALEADGYWTTTARIRGSECLVITAANDRGVLYGVLALLSKIARGESIAQRHEVQNPYAAIRWVNQWDNLDGRIERGYGGPSIFFARPGCPTD